MPLNIKAISNRFYMKHYPEILTSKPEDLDKHHGEIQALFGCDTKYIDFFDTCIPKDFVDNGEYSLFKAEIFGIGKNKFFYNEDNMLDFDHSICKNLTDVIYNHKKISHEIAQDDDSSEFDDVYSQPFSDENFLNQSCVWVCIVENEQEVSYYSIVDVMAHAGWNFQERSNDKVDELIRPIQVIGPDHGLVDDETGDVFYDSYDEYPTPIIDSLADELIDFAYEVSNKYTIIVKEHFQNHQTIFYKSCDSEHNSNLIIVPNIEAGNTFNILDFERSIQESHYESVDIIDKYSSTLVNAMNLEIEEKFKELHYKYEHSIDIFSKTSRSREPVLVQPEVFAMMVGGHVEIEERD